MSCPDCGASVAGRAACQDLFESLIARDFSDVLYFRMHRLAVDAYALQHPDRYCRSAKSLAAHLSGVCVALERDGERSELNARIQRWLSTNPALQRPEPPAARGAHTIADVVGADEPLEHERRVRAWAASAWEAWSAYQALARDWVEQAAGAVPVR